MRRLFHVVQRLFRSLSRSVISVAPVSNGETPVSSISSATAGGTRLIDRLPDREPRRPHVTGRNVERRDLEDLDPVARGDQVARTGGDAQPRELRRALGSFPRREPDELVGADEEDRIAPVPAPQHVHRVYGEGVEHGPRSPGNAARAIGSRTSAGATGGLWPGEFADEHDEPIEGEMAASGGRKGDVPVVRRIG